MSGVASIRIATRSSELALFQARQVQAALTARGIDSELVTYKTIGDKRLDQPLSAIGAKGLFTKELEDDLAAGRVQCCVHSLKDLPTEMPGGLEIVALLPREDPRDVLLVNSAIGARTLSALPTGTRVGTSSLRRRAQLLAMRPDLEVVELRGNVPTRVRKVDDRTVDTAILAAAGLHRLGIGGRIDQYLEPPAWLPAAGQGAIAIQIRADDAASRALFSPLADRTTMMSTAAERAFLAALEGGCQVPIGAMVVSGDAGATLHGFISDVRAERVIRGAIPLVDADPSASGRALAAVLREQGAGDVLRELRAIAQVPPPQPE
jgi:hydroxymethylbilane synthase